MDQNDGTRLFRVTGNGKYACIWAKSSQMAKERFSGEFFIGAVAETCEYIA